MHSTTSNPVVAALAQEMNERWRQGERPRVEEYLTRDPRLSDRDTILALIYEEFCLRLQEEPDVKAAEYVERFPQYRAELEVLLGCHRLLASLGPHMGQAPPALEDALGPFRILAELGRGGLGRVYLARQSSLGDRPVVLKVTPRAGREHVALARLQHTNIVPLYAAHDDLAGNLRILCMPYFGNASWSAVLTALAVRPVVARAGGHLLEVVDQLQASMPVTLPQRGPVRDALARSGYVEAVCRVGMCLADALNYAHERGLVHLDLKPSNVLLAMDGQPMLLDFHLAQEPLRAGQPAPEWLGGTPGYMAPEQQAALSAAAAGQPIPHAIDGRADLYALGLLLYESLAGKLPDAPGKTRLRTVNSHVSVGLSDIIRRCLAPRPEDRYPDAAALVADLHRHLADRPLQGVRNRSLAERWRKWRRRRPSGLVLAGTFAAVLAVTSAIGLSFLDRWAGQRGQARAALADGLDLLERGQLGEAASSFRRGLALVEHQPGANDLYRDLRARLHQVDQARHKAERADAVRELHRLADSLRFLHGADWSTVPAAHVLAGRCARLWDKRRLVLEQLGPAAKNDLLDLALLWNDLRVRLAATSEQAQEHRAALELLAEAETMLGPSHVLYRQQERHALALGQAEAARAAQERAAAAPPRTAWDHYVLGRQLIPPATPPAPGKPARPSPELAQAAAALEEALRQEPHSLWANYYFGQCAYRAGRYDEAIRAFSVAIGAAPDAELFAARALAHAAQGQAEAAVRDHAHARKLQPALAVPLAAIHYNLAVAQAGRGQVDAARVHLDLALRDQPEHAPSRHLLRQLAKTGSP